MKTFIKTLLYVSLAVYAPTETEQMVSANNMQNVVKPNPLTKIPFIVKVLRFLPIRAYLDSSINIKKLISTGHVHSSWYEALHEYYQPQAHEEFYKDQIKYNTANEIKQAFEHKIFGKITIETMRQLIVSSIIFNFTDILITGDQITHIPENFWFTQK